jgi:hypothetical protein
MAGRWAAASFLISLGNHDLVSTLLDLIDAPTRPVHQIIHALAGVGALLTNRRIPGQARPIKYKAEGVLQTMNWRRREADAS